MNRFLSLLILLTSAVAWAGTFSIPAPGINPSQPQIAVSPSGRSYVVFGEKETGKIFISVGTGLTNFTEPKLVGTLPKLALGMRRGPRVAVSSKGVVVAAISHESGNLFSWNSGKMTWVNDQAGSAREGLHDLDANENGTAFLVWLDLRNKKMELWGTTSTNGGRSWGTNFLVHAEEKGPICECCHPTATVLDDGTLIAMWRNSREGARDMYVASSKDGFKARKLGRGTWKLNACPMDGGDFLVTPRGEIISAWRRENQIFISSELEPERLVAPSGRVPVIGYLSEPVVFWQDNGKLWKKTGSAPAKVLAEKGAFVSLAKSSRGLVAVWEANGGVEGELITE